VFFFITEKVSSLSDVRSPSAHVTGLTEGVNTPVVNEINASFALSGSAPITWIFLVIPFTQAEVPLRSPPPPTGATTISRSPIS
jgi:hypothetical protein